MYKIDETEIERMRLHLQRKKKFVPEMYEELLAPYLGEFDTLTLYEYASSLDVDNTNILLIRHDIDHDFETALLMAKWEAERGIRSTYCVLHSAWYYGKFVNGHYEHTEELIGLCKGLSGLGHEVNLHNNFLVLGLKTGVDPVQIMREELEFLRSNGIEIWGTSTHGDKLCRELNFRNLEIFTDLTIQEFGGRRDLVYENNRVSVGTINMSELGLVYEAYDFDRDFYITDSGGAIRTIKNAPGRRPMMRNKEGYVVGFLTHPVWWDFN